MSDDKKGSENTPNKDPQIVSMESDQSQQPDELVEELAETTESTDDTNELKDPTKSDSVVDPKLETNATFTDPAELFNNQPMPRLDAPKSSRKMRPLPIIASILSIAALIGVGWASYNQYQMSQDWQKLETELTQQIVKQTQFNQTASQAAQNSLQTANQNQQLFNQQALLVDQLRQALTANQQRVKELSGRQKQDWLLAEAEYLIKIAQLKITLEKDKMTAIALLKTADERVLATADNTLLELRQMLAQDISDLELIHNPDISGITSQINVISNQIPQLNLIALQFEPLEATAQQSLIKDESEFSWGKLYDNFLKDFVVIKDHSEPVAPLMTVSQRGNLNANIQLALQQAQIAVLRGEQSLYEINLNKAITWIGEFFQHDEISQTLLENLTVLSQSLINIQLPQQLKSKQSIQVINQQRLYQWLENNKPIEGESL